MAGQARDPGTVGREDGLDPKAQPADEELQRVGERADPLQGREPRHLAGGRRRHVRVDASGEQYRAVARDDLPRHPREMPLDGHGGVRTVRPGRWGQRQSKAGEPVRRRRGHGRPYAAAA